jgi:hypothetical protein
MACKKGVSEMRDKSLRAARCLALAVALCTPVASFSQSCALCYTQAAGSGSRMIAALRSGILVLAIPPTLICAGITWMAYKKRNQFNDDGDAEMAKDPQ